MVFGLNFEGRVLQHFLALLDFAFLFGALFAVRDYNFFYALNDVFGLSDVVFEGATIGLNFEFEFDEGVLLVDFSLHDVGEDGGWAELGEEAEDH